MKTKKILGIVKFISWIIFIGLCIKTGALIISFFESLFINPSAAKDLPMDLDLSALYHFNTAHYAIIVLFMIFFLLFKTFIFYLVIKIFSKVNLNKPFRFSVADLTTKISYVSFGTGLIALVANVYTEWMVKKGAYVPLNWEYSGYLFMAGIIFIVGQLFRRGIEIQSENELTI